MKNLILKYALYLVFTLPIISCSNSSDELGDESEEFWMEFEIDGYSLMDKNESQDLEISYSADYTNFYANGTDADGVNFGLSIYGIMQMEIGDLSDICPNPNEDYSNCTGPGVDWWYNYNPDDKYFYSYGGTVKRDSKNQWTINAKGITEEDSPGWLDFTFTARIFVPDAYFDGTY